MIRTEKVELESDRVALIEAVMENKRKTKALEDDLLYRLTSTQVGPGHTKVTRSLRSLRSRGALWSRVERVASGQEQTAAF